MTDMLHRLSRMLAPHVAGAGEAASDRQEGGDREGLLAAPQVVEGFADEAGVLPLEGDTTGLCKCLQGSSLYD